MNRWGKYRGTVVNDVDPEQRGRVQVEVPEVYGAALPSLWAEPCLPPGYSAVPPIGTHVWVEFEHGDPSWPIWVGVRSLAGRDHVPWPQAIELRTVTGAAVAAAPSGVAVSNGRGAQIELQGPTVRVNGGAFEVT